MYELKTLKIATLNCCSVVRNYRRLDLEKMASEYNPLIILLQETRLKPEHNLVIKNYTCVRNDCVDSRLGTAILYKGRFLTEEVDLKLSFVECTAIVLMTGNTMGNILIVSVYIPGSTSGSNLVKDLEKLHLASTNYSSCIIGGDFNSRNTPWDSGLNSNGIAFKKWLDQSCVDLIHVTPNRPTRMQSGSCIDHFLLSNNLTNTFNPTDIINTPSFSDHNFVQLHIKFNNPVKFLIKPPKYAVDYSKVDWIKFYHRSQAQLRQIPISDSSNLSNQQIDQLISKLVQSVSGVIKQCIPQREIKQKEKYKNLPVELETLLSEQTKIRRAYEKECRKLFPNMSMVTRMKSDLSNIKNMVKNKTDNFMRASFSERVEKIKLNHTTFASVNRLTGKNNRKKIKTLKIDDITITDSKAINLEFKNHYKSVFSKYSAIGPTVDEATACTQNISNNPSLITTFTTANKSTNPIKSIFTNLREVRIITKNLNNKKSAGPDSISNYIIKKLPHCFTRILTIILNNCLNNSYFPESWKVAKIIPIPKSAHAQKIADYRPISLVDNLGKVLEQLILTRLSDKIETTIPSYQFGFRKEHSTVDALSFFRDKISQTLNDKKVGAACLLDIRGAFDAVWTDGLILKLKRLQFTNFWIKMIHSFLTDRLAAVITDENCSEKFSIERGVPQGTKLGPLLYNLFTCDQPDGDGTVEIIQYADDTLVFCRDVCPVEACKTLESFLIILNNYYKKWGISINPNKSQLIIFRAPSPACGRGVPTQSRNAHVSINGISIPTSDQVKYLGVIFTHRFKFNLHVYEAIKKAQRAYGAIRPIISHLKVDQKTKEVLYNQLIRPRLTYAFPVWISASKTAYQKLILFERKILRVITGLFRKDYFVNGYRPYVSVEELHSQIDIVTLIENLENITLNYLDKYEIHNNPLIQENLNRQSEYVNKFYMNTTSIRNHKIVDLVENTSQILIYRG